MSEFSTTLVPEFNKVYERRGSASVYPLLFLQPADPDAEIQATPEQFLNVEVIACFSGEDYKFITGNFVRRLGLREASPEVTREFLMGVRRSIAEGLTR